MPLRIAHDVKVPVSLDGLTCDMLRGLSITVCILDNYGVDTVLTSGTDGTHSPTSLHPTGNAVDIRTRGQARVLWVGTLVPHLTFYLGNQFDVVLEGDHLHIEFDPDPVGGKAGRPNVKVN